MITLVLALFACSTVADEAAPKPGPTVSVTQADESKFPEITVNFEVKQADQKFILDAKKEEFRVTEDGQERPILRFEAPMSTLLKPTTIVLVLDHSGSMKEDDKIGGLKKAVASFLQDLPEGSRIAVIAFSGQVKVICPFTTNRGEVREAVESLRTNGGTRYYDAVTAGLELLGEESGRRAILALTDGMDTESRNASLESTIIKARKLGLPVHTLGLGKEDEIAVDDLTKLAVDTRGQHYLAKDAASLRKIYEEIAQKLGSSYSLMYQTDRKVPDGTLRPIRIYYAKATQAAETAVFIRGMVVREAGWSPLFLVLLVALVALSRLPGFKF